MAQHMWGVLDNIVDNLNKVTNTFWGISVLFVSMWMAVKGFHEIAYYFAGIGSTLLGIGKHDVSQTAQQINNRIPPDNTEIK